MVKYNFIAAAFVLISTFNSCKTNNISQEENTSSTSEIWEDGITIVSGEISEVVQEKDGQTITLFNNKGVKYMAVISIPNLRENHAQYRKFKVGEKVTFKGNLIESQRMIVREVLEMK